VKDLAYSRDEEILDTQVSKPHVVILGAGASLAALPKGDRCGKRLPLMNNLIEVCGLAGVLSDAGIDVTRNFEDLYAELSDTPQYHKLLDGINDHVEDYFASLKLPEQPTIYDTLVLSLRPKDLIATFNWDPFLYQACWRNHAAAPLPRVVYLHGNVAVGYCLAHRKKGMFGDRCSVCGTFYTPSRLLYPIKKKGYNADPFISVEWKGLRSELQRAFMLTIFGYAAPKSDVEAVELMNSAWGNASSREFEQIELIDVKNEEELRDNWAMFIHTHHYDIYCDFYDSWIARHPRRSCEAAWQQFFEAKFISSNDVPQTTTLAELWSWFQPLLSAESEHP
jgi:hypothetical protein